MSDDFLSRGSRRKQAAAQGLPADEPVQPARQAVTGPPDGALNQDLAPVAVESSQPANAPHLHPDGLETQQTRPQSEEPLPTLQDAQALTPASDFQSFMRQGVPSEVRNAAVKKLFTDPHFNVMDGLDIYIGDYNTPDPLPAGMLEKMVGAELLNVFSKKSPELPIESAQSPVKENPEQSPDAPESPPFVAQSPPSPLTPTLQATPAMQAPEPTEHDHPDLQLQPNHAPSSPSPGPSTG